jgi:hypothetical protein
MSNVQIDLGRLRSWLALHRIGVGEFARRVGLGERHLHAVATGDRALTSAVAQAVRNALDEPGWNWVTRQTNALIAPAASEPATSSTTTTSPSI